MRELIENGYVYIATPPLYKITYKNGHEYAWTDEELREKVNKLKNVQIQRYKGLGEMNATQLKETTMDPANRTLIQVEITEELAAEKEMMILMGDDVEPRREWIETNVSFDFDDNFSLEDIEEDE
jgi:topoisomerase-4 subunit B